MNLKQYSGCPFWGSLFLYMLNELSRWMSIPSTSAQKSEFSSFLVQELTSQMPFQVERQALDTQGENLFFYSGTPKVVFCTHWDTVPPYLPPVLQGNTLFGRGACDAKGQILVMKEVCKQILNSGGTDIGLLLLDQEETGSVGARFFAKEYHAANKPILPFVIVGEPTQNRLITSGKGIMCFKVEIRGKAAHSGYPQYGRNAMDSLADYMQSLRWLHLPMDPVLGATTYNIGKLQSLNPSNIICDYVSFEVYFRTTHTTHTQLRTLMESFNNDSIRVQFMREDNPIDFYCPPTLRDKKQIELDTVAFGSDAPVLDMFAHRLLYGPGSITLAHTPNESITLEELQKAVEHLTILYNTLNTTN